jgi:hypothetical protein
MAAIGGAQELRGMVYFATILVRAALYRQGTNDDNGAAAGADVPSAAKLVIDE